MIDRSFASLAAGRLTSRVVAREDASQVADDADVLGSPERCLALIGALADGGRHAFTSLADRVLGANARHGARLIRGAVADLQDLGMPLAIDDDAVRATRFVALDARTLAAALPRWDARVVGSNASTNRDLLGALRADRTALLPALLASELQRAGRGRLGRGWASAPAVSLTASFALRSGRRLATLAGVTLVCGLAVRDAVAACGVDARLKWPNDLLCDDRKLAGILVEAHAIDATAALVVGVGLNVGTDVAVDGGVAHSQDAAASARSQAALPPTDLATCGARTLDRNRLLIDLAGALERRLRRFDAAGFAAFVDEWNDADAFRGRTVRLAPRDGAAANQGDGFWGIARGVDATGALLVDADGDPRTRTRVISGDLSLRPLAA